MPEHVPFPEASDALCLMEWRSRNWFQKNHSTDNTLSTRPSWWGRSRYRKTKAAVVALGRWGQPFPDRPGDMSRKGPGTPGSKLWRKRGTWNPGRSHCFLSWAMKLQATIFRKSRTATQDRREIQDSCQSGWGPGGEGPGRAAKELGCSTWEPGKGNDLSKIVPNILMAHSKNLRGGRRVF